MTKLYLTVFIIASTILLTVSHPVRRDTRLECGSLGINLDPILNAADYEEILPCYYEHDLCYRNCSVTRDQCDCRFYHCLQEKCVPRFLGGLDCSWLSIGGYRIVHEAGALSFAQDQSSSGCAVTYNGISDSSSGEHDLDNPQHCSS